MLIIVVCLLMEKKSLSLELTKKNINFPTQFCLGTISNRFNATESREVSLNGNVYDFSVGNKFIHQSNILKINRYLMTKNNMK